ncbi:MAG TPA: hypothetical protein VG223_17975 [Solirubrobacteraceae bacterium]|jgi:O-antigen/teichoic acid export membrane protein|nr:hypothetical protein [Solirubrobacteraceae bacterium]
MKPPSLREVLEEQSAEFVASLKVWRTDVAARRELRRRIEQHLATRSATTPPAAASSFTVAERPNPSWLPPASGAPESASAQSWAFPAPAAVPFTAPQIEPDLQLAPTPASGAAGRLSVITIDQVISGASNVLAAVLAARVLGVGAFGLFGIIFLVYTMTLGITRALVSDPLLIHPEDAEQRPGDAVGTSSVLAVGIAVVVLGAGALVRTWDVSFGDALIVFGACFPLLVFQDLGRYLGYATQRPGFALVLDTVWLVLLFGAVAALFATHTRTLAWYVAAWAGSGALAGLLLFARYSVRYVRPSLAWLRYTWTFSWQFLVSYTATQGAALAGSSGIGAIAGRRALSGVQGAVLFVRPFTTFQVAVVAAGMGEVTRLPTNLLVRLHVAKATALATAVAVGNVLVMLFLPNKLGEVVLGASWHAAQPLLLPTGAQIICIALITGMRAGLLGQRATKKVMGLDIVSTIAVMIAAFGGAVADGAKGALWLVAACQGLTVVGYLVVFLRHTQADLPVTGPATTTAVTVATAPPERATHR